MRLRVASPRVDLLTQELRRRLRWWLFPVDQQADRDGGPVRSADCGGRPVMQLVSRMRARATTDRSDAAQNHASASSAITWCQWVSTL